ncbi:hypothetical protein MCG98_02500 [Ruminococcus sp. OA3]|uniref:hypothetical protein n=1 Tax=Ruminococcus sp. OA3 TaxID=2914164 RepID=UPI001F05F2CB|nr:hypothetical protein [Ruminococcus sp. OA3]MCH1981449.1 hypothetical protein [Ruminococcus sp. OA3]
MLARTSSKIAVLLLLLLTGSVCRFATGKVEYVNEQGDTETGLSAERIRQVIEENDRINLSEEYQSEDEQKNNIAYCKMQGFYDIRQLLVRAYCDFREYDYYRPDSLRPEDAESFYGRRTEQLKTLLTYGYADGWKQLFEFTPMLLLPLSL